VNLEGDDLRKQGAILGQGKARHGQTGQGAARLGWVGHDTTGSVHRRFGGFRTSNDGQ